jgi:putative DNA primase/helicase
MIGKRIACPAHGGRDLNCSIWRDEHSRRRAKCWSHDCDEADILAALGEIPNHHQPDDGHHHQLDEVKRTENAKRNWSESRSAHGTPVEIYLRSRGITINIPSTLRFHPSLRHPTGVYLPAMVAAVEHVRTGMQIVAVQRTWLRADGAGKAHVEPQKAALGPIAGGAVRLAPAGETLCIAEGIETGLSVLQATGLPTWAALGTSNLARAELPEISHQVIIAADSDDAGEQAAQQTAQRLLREGRRVRIARPPTGRDFNDVLMEGDR